MLDWCRLCMKEGEGQIDIYTSTDDDNPSYAKFVEMAFGVEVSDHTITLYISLYILFFLLAPGE